MDVEDEEETNRSTDRGSGQRDASILTNASTLKEHGPSTPSSPKSLGRSDEASQRSQTNQAPLCQREINSPAIPHPAR